MNRLFLIVLIGGFLGIAGAQQSESSQPTQAPTVQVQSPDDLAAKVPPPKADDVKSMDGILRAIYDVISGPAGGRDWNRFRSLFLPKAHFAEVGKGKDGKEFVISWTVDEFIHDGTEVFAKEPFYENAIVNESESFGGVTQAFSSYESRHAPGEKPFERGINSIQLLNDGMRWWVFSIAWASERADNPLPSKFAKKKK